jgi:hypothetical protein
MEGNVEDDTQSKMQKAWNGREKIWQSYLASCLIYPNDPLGPFLYEKIMVSSLLEGLQEVNWLQNPR